MKSIIEDLIGDLGNGQMWWGLLWATRHSEITLSVNEGEKKEGYAGFDYEM